LAYSDLGPVDARKSPRIEGDCPTLALGKTIRRLSREPMDSGIFMVVGGLGVELNRFDGRLLLGIR